MIIGMHNVLDALARRKADLVSSDGALWIVLMDGLFLVPLIFAGFFYPKAVLLAVGAVLLLTLAIYEAVHYAHTHRLGPDRFWHRHS